MKMHTYFVLAAIALLSGCSPQPSKKETLHVGASVASITPDAGAFIAGDALNRRFTGVHDSLYAKAVVVSDDTNSLAILTFDCIGMLYPTLIEIRKEVAARIPRSEFNPDHIVMASTHTHAGPDVVGIWGPDQMTSGVDSVYMSKLISTSAGAIVAAWKNRQPATVRYAVSDFGTDWVYNISDSLNLDRTLSVLQFLDKNERSIATISNFACHPTIMDGVTTLVSADYVGGMYAHLNRQLGGVNLFIQGAIGGWVQPEYEPKTFETADKRGRELGQAIEDALKAPDIMNSLGITFNSRMVELPISNEGFRQLAAAGVIDREISDKVTTEIVLFSIGSAMFVTHPGETTPAHSLASRELMKTPGPKFVIGFGMDGLGYLLTPEFLAPGTRMKHVEYLSGMSIDPHAGEVLMNHIMELANEK